MSYRRDLVFETFASMDALPQPLLNYLQELQKIQGGNINSVRFNKCKKDAQKLLSSWIDMAGGLMFERYLFEFQVEFDLFSEKLYKDIIALQKKFDQKKQKKVEAAARRFLRKVKDLPVPSEIFVICFIHEEDLVSNFVPKKPDPKQQWNVVKDILGITPEFEESVVLDDLLEKERVSNEKVLQDLYINTPYGPVSKSFLKKQTIKIDTGCRIKIKK